MDIRRTRINSDDADWKCKHGITRKSYVFVKFNKPNDLINKTITGWFTTIRTIFNEVVIFSQATQGK